MTDREKLIQLLIDSPGLDTFLGDYDTDADFLLANGVTFATDTNVGSKWIPVTERLPERDEKCLCRYTFGEKELMYFYQVLDYYATDPQPHFQHTLGDNGMRVTHWMPLPKPPKMDGGA